MGVFRTRLGATHGDEVRAASLDEETWGRVGVPPSNDLTSLPITPAVSWPYHVFLPRIESSRQQTAAILRGHSVTNP